MPRPDPAAIAAAAAISTPSSGPNALAPAVALAENVFRSASIAAWMSVSSLLKPAAEPSGPIPITSLVSAGYAAFESRSYTWLLSAYHAVASLAATASCRLARAPPADAAASSRVPGPGPIRRGGGHVRVGDGLVHALRGQRERFLHVDHVAGGGGVLADGPGAERPPGQRQQHQARAENPQLGGCVRGQRPPGHQPILPICWRARVTTASGSRTNCTGVRNLGWFPAVITQPRKSLIARALAGSGCLVATMAYS